MSRAIITRVEYGKHKVSPYHRRIGEIVWPMDTLGAIMDHCTTVTKSLFARTCRRLYRLLRDRIAQSNVRLVWSNNIGLHVQPPQLDILRDTHAVVCNWSDNYAKLIPPNCENCGRVMGRWDPVTETTDFWNIHYGPYILINTGNTLRHIYTFMCGRCINFFGGNSIYDIATMRMRIVNDLKNYEKFYISNINYRYTHDRYYWKITMAALCKYTLIVHERKIIRKQQLLEWIRQDNQDFHKFFAISEFPFYALQTKIFSVIVDLLNIRDIKSAKCVSKLQKIVFTGAEIILNNTAL